MGSSARLVQQMAALAALGFKRVDSPPAQTESLPLGDGRYKVTSGQSSMGTLVSVVVISQSLDRGEEAVGRAYGEMERIVKLLNRYDPDSALFSLNAEGHIEGPPTELGVVVWGSLRMNELSGGAFDPTVQPLVDLFRSQGSRLRTPSVEIRPPSVGGAQKPPRLLGPSDAEVRDALALVDARSVAQTHKSIRLGKEGMGMTLDGIAKGYVVDRMAEVLLAHGIEDFLINAGGDIRAGGRRADGEPWRVGVQDPEKEGVFPDVITLADRAVATSGSYEIYFDPDRKHHHIVSSETGASPQQSQSVSVTAPTAMTADALATGVFVMEPERGLAFIDSLPDCACLVVDHAGRHHASRAWRSAAGSLNPKAGAT